MNINFQKLIFNIVVFSSIHILLGDQSSYHAIASQSIILPVHINYSKESSKEQKIQYLQQLLNLPGKLTKKYLKNQISTPYISGIYGLYAGYVAHSSSEGLLIFPKKHQSNDILIIITKKLKPVIVRENTVSYFAIDKSEEYTSYYCSRNKDELNATDYWTIEEGFLAKNKRIPFASLVIYASPQHAFLKKGTFSTPRSSNLILPPCIIANRKAIIYNPLSFVKISKYFAPLNNVQKFSSSRYASFMLP